MANISIKNVPESIIAAVHARAERNHRSLQGEMIAILEAIASNENLILAPIYKGFEPLSRSVVSRVISHDKRGQPIVRQGSRGVTDIARELRSRHPEPISAQSSSLEILRELRASR